MSTNTGAAMVGLGRIVELTLDQIKRNLRAYGLVALILVGVPQLLIEGLRLYFAGDLEAINGTRDAVWISGIPSLVLSSAAYLILIKGVAGDRAGRTPTYKSMTRSIPIGLGSAVLLWIVISLGIVLGLVLLIVPGVILGLMWAVAIPAQAVENKGVSAALKRSAELTHGLRWRVMGIMAAYVALVLVFSLLIGLGSTLTPGGLFSYLTVVFNALAQAALTVVGAVFGAVLYFELRRFKEGEAPSLLAEVFA